MSRATNQSLCMLALVAGAAQEILRQKLITHVAMRQKVEWLHTETKNCINRWDETGDSRKNQEQMHAWLTEWEHVYVKSSTFNSKSAPELVSICDHLLTDLLGLLKVPWKRQMLEALHEQVHEVYNWLDNDWRNLPALESAGKGVCSLAAIIN